MSHLNLQWKRSIVHYFPLKYILCFSGQMNDVRLKMILFVLILLFSLNLASVSLSICFAVHLYYVIGVAARSKK